jgi:hypothetical protein
VLAANGSMQIKNTADRNIKLAPSTVLMMLAQGKVHEVQTRGAGDVPFELKPKSIVLLKTGSGAPSPTSLSDVIVQHKINNVYQYNAFTAGVVLASFVAKKARRVVHPRRQRAP